MDITIYPGKLHGNVAAIPSKSQAHRLLICAAFSGKPTTIICQQTNQDIEATADCLSALGAQIVKTSNGYYVVPISLIPQRAIIDCRESGSTLRFLLPIVCALGIETTIHMSGRLPKRPLSPMWEELNRMGCKLSRPSENTIQTRGKLIPGKFSVAGDVSSQFVSGLLFALSLLDGSSKLTIAGKLESKPYVDMTRNALSLFGVRTEGSEINGSFPFCSPGEVLVEGDWSNAAFFLTATALGNDVLVSNLNVDSNQGDRAIDQILKIREIMPVISAADIPDLVPILAVYFAFQNGAIFTDISRLRLKESDRVASITAMLRCLGVHVTSDEQTMCVSSGRFHGGIVDTVGDHRIAMSAAIAATVADGPVTILGAECVEKSYPVFWQEYKHLGGNYEQHIR